LFEDLPSRKSVKKAIKSGRILINEEKASTGTWVKTGMAISLLPPPFDKHKIYETEIEVVYDDVHLAILNKPAGLTTSGNQFRTLENALPHNLKILNQYLPKPTHRLDRATSGLVIVARSGLARIKLGDMLQAGEIKKSYAAIVMGNPFDTGTLEDSINGKKAISSYTVEKRSPDDKYALVHLSPKTGRTHQLRIHCANAGWPILGDKIYGNNKGPGKGLFLCAICLDFKHPISSKPLNISICLPNKFEKFIKNRF